MKIGFINIIILLLSTSSFLFGQDDIQHFTLNIVDTSKTQTEQAKEIYNWVTTNISYDVSSLKKGVYPNLSPIDLIKQGEGLCSDFSNLFEAMCKSIGIEAYTISGYSKGYLYNKQKPFLRSNHSWNVIYTDSSWKHIDATWGSGYINTKPHLYNKILNSVTGIPYVNSIVYFTKENTDKYFNIPIDSLITSHYPIDPKWLFNSKPKDFYSFWLDSIDSNVDYPNYLYEIERIRNKSTTTQQVIEGENSIIYNNLNHFNLASGYFIKSLDYNIEREVTHKNISQFEKYYSEYETIVTAIDRFKTVNDSIYRKRLKDLKSVARDQKRLTGRIKSKTLKAQKAHKSSQKKIVGKSSSYRKKMNNYQMNIGRTQIKKKKTSFNNEIISPDTLEVMVLIEELNKLYPKRTILNEKLDSLILVVDNFSFADAQIDDSIAAANQLFKKNIDVLWSMILSGEEAIIIDYVDSLKVVYKEIENFLIGKKDAKSDLQNTGRAYYSNSILLEKNIKQKMSLNAKLLKLTNNPDSIINAYNQSVEELIICYRKSMTFTKKLTNHNEIQTEVRQKNLEALKQQKKSINKENKFFVSWYENHLKLELEQYTRDKELAKEIRSTTLRNKKTIEMKLKKYTE